MSHLTSGQRNALISNGLWLYANSAHIAYSLHRPFPLLSRDELAARFSKGETVAWDCAGFTVQTFHLVADVNDPSGQGYDGRGNTETILSTLTDHYTDPRKALPGALVIFGADLPLADQHVCMVMRAGENPTVLSHGQPGVRMLPLTEEAAAHEGNVLFCSPGSL